MRCLAFFISSACLTCCFVYAFISAPTKADILVLRFNKIKVKITLNWGGGGGG